MGFAAIFGLLAPIFTDLIKRMFPDPEKQAEAEAKLQELLNAAQIEAYKAEAVENEAKKEIITTEMNQGGWASQWRAYMMMLCISVVGYNWIVVSLLNAFLRPLGVPIDAMPVPPELWTLITVGLGGYIGKETMATYTQAKVEKARLENPPDDKRFYDILRQKVFKAGMTQEQVDALQDALKAREGK